MTPALKTAPPAGPRGFWQDLLWENPMFDEAVRAFRKFLRGGNTQGRALNYVALGLIGFFYLWLLAVILHSGENASVPILYFELVAVTIQMPLSIYGAVAGERERSTWEALILTRLTPAQIAAGKLLWRILVLAGIMLILAVPIFASAVIKPTQGPSPAGIVADEFLILTWGIFLCAFGLWVSVNSRRSVTAMGILAGVLLSALVLFPVVLSLFGLNAYGSSGLAAEHPRVTEAMQFLLEQNPFVALNDGTASSSSARSVYFLIEDLVPIAPLIYLAGTILFAYLTQVSLRRLEEPQKK